MSLIIAATDFSEVAENAVRYACALAATQKSKVTIIHSFIIPVMFSDIPMPGSLVSDAQTEAEERMEELVAKMKASYPDITVIGRVVAGNTIDALDDYIDEDHTPWLVAVGNNSKDSSSWPDNVMMDTLRKLAYPVLAVPPSYSYQAVKNICFAFDNRHTGNDYAFHQVVEITRKLDASLHVLNIQTGPDQQEINVDAKTRLSLVNPQFHIIHGSQNIDASIQDFVNGNNIDILILTPHAHSFFEGLFHKSHTKSVTHDATIPVVAVHEQN